MFLKWRVFAFSVVAATLLQGAAALAAGPTFILNEGHYEGSVVKRGGTGLTQILVSAELSKSGRSSWKLILRDRSGSSEEEIIERSSRTKVKLQLSGSDQVELPYAEEHECFVQVQPTEIKFCTLQGALLVEINDAQGPLYSLSLTAFSSSPQTPSETPSDYTLDQAMQRAFSASFASRAEFQRSMQAAHVARNAYMNLLPHLTIKSILSVATASSFLSALNAVGDLVPFLLPTRWIQARGAQTTSLAEKYALGAMRGDAGLQVESLAYTWNKDAAVIGDYSEAIAEAQKLADQVRTLEVLGQFPLGTGATIQTSVNSMRLDLSILQEGWTASRATLSQALGLVNPEAVQSLRIEGAGEIPSPESLDPAAVAQAALERSFELQQISYLIQVARNATRATYFQWLDPAGDPTAGLGAGLASAVEISKDKVRALEIQKAQLESAIRGAASTTVNHLKSAANRLAITEENERLQDERLVRVLQTVRFGRDVNLIEVVGVYQDRLKARISRREARTSLELARAKLDRLLLRAFYSRLAFGS